MEAQVLRAIGRLSLPPEWREEALARARQLLGEETVSHTSHALLEARMCRLARLYEDGLKSEAEYEEEPMTDLSAVAAVLGNLPELFDAATVTERRAVLVQLVDQVYLRHDALLAIRPTRRAWPVMQIAYERALQGVGTWAGWGSNPRPSV